MELNKIYNENCINTMQRMDDNFIDLTITSPPYDNLRDYKGYTFDFESIAKELYRITKEGGVLVWVVGDQVIDNSETGTSFRQALYFKEIGFNLHDTMIYQKTGIPFPGKNRYNQIFEYMFIFSKGKPKTFNPLYKKNKTFGTSDGSIRRHRTRRDTNGDLIKSNTNSKIKEYGLKDNIWIITSGYCKSTKDKLAFNHPATYPEKLVKDHIYTWSNEGDLIYDPFMGSGTTAKAAHHLDRKWIGSEISKEYTDLANKRLEPYLTQTKLF